MQLKAFAGQHHDAHIVAHLMMGMSPLLQSNPIAAAMLQRHVLEHIRLKAEEDVEAELFTSYGTDPDRMISALQKEGMVALRIAQYLKETKDLQTQLSGQGESEEDPLIKLKEQELNQRAQNDQARLALDQQKQQETNQINLQKLQLQQAKVNQTGGQYAG
jgi:hypothetical protein